MSSAPTTRCSTKTVKVGDRIGSRWIIDEGLQPGARVVVEGARTSDGTVVNPKPFAAPTESALSPCRRFFIRRPIVAIVIAIITVLGGLVAMQALPIAQFPDIVPPQITVTATYNGADALTIEQAVAAPLEQQMNGVDNMLYMQSTNANDGTMQLVVTFDVETDPNIDQVNVQNRVAQAQPNLPPDVNTFGLTLRKATGFPMMIVSLSSPKDTYDALFLANYANINIIDALYRVPGVGEVRLFGASDYAMRIWVKPDRLAKLGLTVPELVRAVQQQSTVNPSGPDRRPAGAARTGVQLHRPRAGAAADGGGVWRDCGAIESGRLGRQAERRRPHRARRPQLWADRSRQRQAWLRRRHLSDAGLERARRRRRRQEDHDGSRAGASRPTCSTAIRSIRPCRCPKGSKKS